VWHATKVTFANEIGNIAKAAGVDGREVMDVVCQDHKLNLSRYYLRPGFAFGGSCLPKDVRALTYRAASLDVKAPLLDSLMASNASQVQNAFDLIERQDKRKIALLGLAFKAGTDDLRESPLVDLAERLIGKGYQLHIFDENVEYARVHGANKEYIEAKIPHVSSLLHSDLQQVIDDAEVIVLGNNDPRFASALQSGHGKQVIDLVGFMPGLSDSHSQGICW
jgi:GDP-mannose 6-dehydrogenase